MIYVQLRKPDAAIFGRDFKTNTKIKSSEKNSSKGKTVHMVQAAELAIKIRSHLEALQHAHCDFDNIVIEVTKDTVSMSGTIYAWIDESVQLAERAIAKIDSATVELNNLPLVDFSMSLEMSIDKTVRIGA